MAERGAMEAEQVLMDRARTAWARIKKDEIFVDWLTVGEGLVWCREQALLRAQASDMGSHKAKMAMQAVLKEQGLDDIDKAYRSDLLDIMAVRDKVEAWRHALPLTSRLSWNNPRTVWARFQKQTMTPQGDAPKKPKSPERMTRVELQDMVTELQGELDAWQKPDTILVSKWETP